MKQEFIDLMQEQNTRIWLCEQHLLLFWLYYFADVFKYNCAEFQKEWTKDMMKDKHLLLIWFRESAKTVWATIKIIHNILYRKKRFQMVYSYDKRKSTSRLYDIAVHLQANKLLIYDFWEVFPTAKQYHDETQKRSIPEFITTNWIKIKASSIWESPRWENYFAKDWAFRPDFIVLDDIDVEKSVQNIEIIDKNYNWLRSELFWWISEDCQILFLWNIIKSDWITIRLEKDYWNNSDWIIRKKALIEDWKITWDRFTDEDIEKRKALLWSVSFNQNYLLIPYSWGDAIIKRHQIKYYTWSYIFDSVIIAIDPAISEKTKSDSFWIVVTWILWDLYYIIEAIELKWEDKDPFKAVWIICALYMNYKANYVIVESVAFQQVMSKLLKQKWIATKEVKPHKDKVTRLLEHQYLFEQWKILFSDKCWTLISQLLEFPNVNHDDLVDALVYSLGKKKTQFMMTGL